MVSGTQMQINSQAAKQRRPNPAKTIAAPKLSNMTGKNCTTRNAQAQLIPVESAMAVPRMAEGYISAVTTNISGESDTAKNAM